MEDLQSILSSHHPANGSMKPIKTEIKATMSAIPDLFFDDVLVKFKLTRVEILLLMYLYRITWCKPNMHKKFGITPMINHEDVSANLDISLEIFHQTIRRLEGFGFIETIRSGQYFVRKFFTEDFDKKYGQTYDNFL